MHLYAEDTTGQRPAGIEELVTVRHESFYEDPDWITKIPANKPLKQWLKERLLP
ncbi:MAG: hypothetical protein JXB15_02775 [Anaerolineales bacterium]|nr:hypothetical protein [Anaerolineales bacterium]